MRRALALLSLATWLAAPAQAVHLKELVFTGTIASGVDSSGGVFGPVPSALNGLEATGRFVWDADLMPGASESGATHYSWTTPGWESRGGFWAGATGPFMSATITVNGITRNIRNEPVNPATGPASHVVVLNDRPDAPAQDSLNASVVTFACYTCSAVNDEYLQLFVAGMPGGFLPSEAAGQDFTVSVNAGNPNSYAIFRLNSGFSVGGITVPNDPDYGNNDRHYAEGSIALATLTLRDVPAVPEPASWALLAGGLVALRLRQTRRR